MAIIPNRIVAGLLKKNNLIILVKARSLSNKELLLLQFPLINGETPEGDNAQQAERQLQRLNKGTPRTGDAIV